MQAADPVELARTVRFCVNLAPPPQAAAGLLNTFAAWPTMHGLGAYYELEVAVVGPPDRQTGYLLNITDLDRAVRAVAIPLVEDAVRSRPDTPPPLVLRTVARALAPRLAAPLARVTWRLTPYYAVATMSTQPDRYRITQHFEFAAAHRLHVASLDDEANRRIFGKCNNPNGHGHNYRLRVDASAAFSNGTADAAAPAVGGGCPFALPQLERIVKARVIDRFDHQHLNLDAAEFADTVPSVENIARVCHRLLVGPIADAGGRLEQVTVWETEKTSATYPAGQTTAGPAS